MGRGAYDRGVDLGKGSGNGSGWVVVVSVSSASFCLFSPLRMVFSSLPHPSKLHCVRRILSVSKTKERMT